MRRWQPPAFCIACLTPHHETVCPLCKFDVEQYRHHPLYLEPGTLLHEQYLLGRVLGQGGFGITYVGMDQSLRRQVAIKEYLPAPLATRDVPSGQVLPLRNQEEHFARGRRSFIQEARKLASFDHPNIVRVRHYFEQNQTAYMVMDYVSGESVADFLHRQDGRLSQEQALQIVLPVLDALQCMHEQQTYHLDVSAHNVLLSEEQRPVLIDFGAAKCLVGDYTHSMSLVLKPGYSPIEQYSEAGELGPWTDIYACAALLHLLLCGSLPPPATERWEERKTQLNLPGAQCSTGCKRALEKALTVKPEKRWQSVIEFRQTLEQSLNEPILEHSSSPRPAHNYVRVFGWGSFAVLVLVIAIWLWLVPPSPVPIAEPKQANIVAPKPKPQEPPASVATPIASNPTPAQPSPEPWRALWQQAEAAQAAQQWAAAQHAYMQVLALHPAHPLASDALQKLAADWAQSVQNQLNNGQISTAAAALQQLRQQWPTHPRLAELSAALQNAEQTQQIARLFAQAEQQRRQLKLTLPLGDNAFETYQQMLKLNPDDAQANAGLQAIAETYANWAREQNNSEKRQDYIQKGLKAWPEHPGLLALQSQLRAPLNAFPESPPSVQSKPSTKRSVALADFQALMAAQRWDAAWIHYQNLPAELAREPRLQVERQRLSKHFYTQAQNALAQQQWTQAEQALNKALILTPQQKSLHNLQIQLQQAVAQQQASQLAPAEALTSPSEPIENRDHVPFTPSF